MLNIAAAVKLWAPRWAKHHVLLHCDNAAAVAVLQSGRSRDPFLLDCARQIWYYKATHDFVLDPHHKSGQDLTTADALSRHHLSDRFRRHVAQLVSSGSYHRQPVDPYMFKLINFKY